jgi:hypothetical protein
MIRLSFAIALEYDIAEQPADFVFNIHAARTPWQTVVTEILTIDPPGEYQLQTDPVLENRYLRLRAGPGPQSCATRPPSTSTTFASRRRCSRKCRSRGSLRRSCPTSIQAATARPTAAAFREPGVRSPAARILARPGDSRLGAHAHRVRAGHVEQQHLGDGHAGGQVGVCRDFAHLMIALCRR